MINKIVITCLLVSVHASAFCSTKNVGKVINELKNLRKNLQKLNNLTQKKTKYISDRKKECTTAKLIKAKWKEANKLLRNDQDKKANKILYDYVAYQDIFPKKRYKACILLAAGIYDTKPKLALENLGTILKYAKREDLTNIIIAEAHKIVGKIYKEKAEKPENVEKKSKYMEIYARQLKKARKFYKKAIDQEDEHKALLVKNLISCTREVANYLQECIHQSISVEKRSNMAEKYFTEIIDYNIDDYKTKKEYPKMACDKILAFIDLGIFHLSKKNEKGHTEARHILDKGLVFATEHKDVIENNFIETLIEILETNISYTENSLENQDYSANPIVKTINI
ncbi:hypothetical protein ACFLYA_00215 [Candidatus Dependentiae bacterium]